MKCVARQYSDQKICTRCELMWDMNDDDPPKCKTDKQIRYAKSMAARDQAMKEIGWLGKEIGLRAKHRYESDKQFARRVREGLKDA